MMKSKNDCRTLELREEELRSYASDLVGFPYEFGIPSEILLMPEEEAREYMRGVQVPSTLQRALELRSGITDGRYKLSNRPVLDISGNEWWLILEEILEEVE